MNQNLKSKMLLFLKKLITIAFLLFVFTFVEIYWSMQSLSERISNGNPDSHFFDDAYLISVFTTVFLIIIFMFLAFIKKIHLKITAQLLIIISTWFFWNYSIFVDRESSWSTYLFKEELMYTLTLSFFPILVLSIVMVFILNYISKNRSITNEKIKTINI
ncbi:hypothetical protein B0A75_11080 [Flavobacterium oncorhynchi]|uniref:Uncharacterized protein n=1 Tax=Flavobacterium oncorhynchi TaxID=728056 RepID=A0A226I005_9FLAO|nr:hypothetical protein [Flavobacterium oncorhynchi]OXA99702.1 hypothetical protein B0A75_11080 [Flavobacterium oncorhynchi]